MPTVEERRAERAARIERLPKWVKQELQRLERDLASEREKLTAGPQNSNTFADPYAAAKRPLGRDITIEFNLGEDDARWGTKVNVRVENGQLVIQGGDQLVIAPVASNVVKLQVRRF